MNSNTRLKDREEAFKLFKTGLSQKQIAEKLSKTEKTISKWKKEGVWTKRLKPKKNTMIAAAYLLVAENIRQQSFPKNKAKQDPLLNSESLNQAISILGEALASNNLI